MRHIPAEITLVALAVSAALASCAAESSYITPAANTPEAPGGGAVESIAGLRVVVGDRAWSSVPLDLAKRVTPVSIRLTNDGERPILIQYSRFELVAVDRGNTFSALPPWKIEGREQLAAGTIEPDLPFDGFYMAPTYRHVFDGYPIWGGPFAFDPMYYDRYYRAWIDLPTPNMLSAALPEGVLARGIAQGFLYFQHIDPDEVKNVRFTFDVVDANTGERLGRIDLPFVVTENREPVASR